MNSTIACLGLEVLLQNQQTSYKIIQKKNKVKKKKKYTSKKMEWEHRITKPHQLERLTLQITLPVLTESRAGASFILLSRLVYWIHTILYLLNFENHSVTTLVCISMYAYYYSPYFGISHFSSKIDPICPHNPKWIIRLIKKPEH